MIVLDSNPSWTARHVPVGKDKDVLREIVRYVHAIPIDDVHLRLLSDLLTCFLPA